MAEVTEDLVGAQKEMGVQIVKELIQSQGACMVLWQWMLFLEDPEGVPV